MHSRIVFLFAVIFLISACKEEEPTDFCSDGILNNGESGIDCGGICEDCPEPTCFDGIQNQNETAVDCGGLCSICQSEFSGYVDGEAYLLKEGSLNYLLALSVYSTPATGTNCHKDFYSFLYKSGQKSSISMRINGLYTGSCAGGPDSAQFHSLFDTGALDYAASEQGDGVVITWYAPDGKQWSSARGEQLDTDLFTVTSSETLTPAYYERHRIRASFNCRVYDNSGSYLPINNATLNVYFKNK